MCVFPFLSLCSLQSLKSICHVGFRPTFISLLLVRAYFSLLPLARNLVWLTAGPFGAPFRRGRSSRFGQIWKRGPGCQGALRWRCQRMMRGNSSPINGENQRFWKHLSKIVLPGRNSRCTFSLTPLTPTCKKRSKWHHLQKIFSARGSSSSFSPFTLKCPNSSFLETNFENFLLMHSAQHSLQRVLSSYRQFSFPLPLHIYMAKISDFGNT